MTSPVVVLGRSPAALFASGLLEQCGVAHERVEIEDDDALDHFFHAYGRVLDARPRWLVRALAFAGLELAVAPMPSVDLALVDGWRRHLAPTPDADLPPALASDSAAEGAPPSAVLGDALFAGLPDLPEGWWARRRRRAELVEALRLASGSAIEGIEPRFTALAVPGLGALPLTRAALALGALGPARGADASVLVGRGVVGGAPVSRTTKRAAPLPAEALVLDATRVAPDGGVSLGVSRARVTVPRAAWPEAWASRVLRQTARGVVAATVVETRTDTRGGVELELVAIEGAAPPSTEAWRGHLRALAPFADVDVTPLGHFALATADELELHPGRRAWRVGPGYVGRVGELGAIAAAALAVVELAGRLAAPDRYRALARALRSD